MRFFTFILASLCCCLTLTQAWAQEIRLTDALGRSLVLKQPPRRVVSLAPSITETLYALGLESRLVGVTDFCNYPPAVKAKARVGGMVNPNIEAILLLRPQLVIATADGNIAKDIYRLEKEQVAVLMVNSRNLQEVMRDLGIIAQALGEKARGKKLQQEMERRIEKVKAQVRTMPRRPLVLAEVEHEPLITVGRGTFLGDLIELAGGRNLAADSPLRYPRFSLEEIVARKPEVILILAMTYQACCEGQIKDWQRWERVPAVAQGNIIVVDSDLVTRPGPRIIEGLETLQEIFLRVSADNGKQSSR
jgi:iron complex transport system substrate-binding protein